MDSFPLYRQEGSQASPNGPPYLLITILFTAVVFSFEIWLDFRQLSKFDLSTAKIPPRLNGLIKDDTFEKSISYRKDIFRYKIVESSFGFVSTVAMALMGYLPYVWDGAGAVTARSISYFGLKTLSPFYMESVQTWIFVVMLSLVDTCLNLPFSLYQTFVLEEKHGFNKSTLALYFKDKLISLALICGLSLPVLSAIIYIVTLGGEHFYFYVWAFLCAFSVIMMTIYPVWIAPLFNKYTELEEGETMDAIRVSVPSSTSSI